jgi:hypothetical protein
MVFSGIVGSVVLEHLSQPWERSEYVHTLKVQRGSYGRQPSLACSRSVCASLLARRYCSPSTRIKVKRKLYATLQPRAAPRGSDNGLYGNFHGVACDGCVTARTCSALPRTPARQQQQPLYQRMQQEWLPVSQRYQMLGTL